jgi:hypothetical protein
MKHSSRAGRRRTPRSLAEPLVDAARGADGERFAQVVAQAATARVLGPALTKRLLAVTRREGDVILLIAGVTAAREVQRHVVDISRRLRTFLRDPSIQVIVQAAPEPAPKPRVTRPARAARNLPLTRDALGEVRDDLTRGRLARWAGIEDSR